MEYVIASDLIKHCHRALGNVRSFGVWSMTPRGMICAVDAPPDRMSQEPSSIHSSMACTVSLGLLCFNDYHFNSDQVSCGGDSGGDPGKTNLQPAQTASIKNIKVPICFEAFLSHSQFPRQPAMMIVGVHVDNPIKTKTINTNCESVNEHQQQQHQAAAAASPDKQICSADKMATSLNLHVLPNQILQNICVLNKSTMDVCTETKFDVSLTEYGTLVQNTFPKCMVSMPTPTIVFQSGILLRTKDFLAAVYDMCPFNDAVCSIQIQKRQECKTPEQNCMVFTAVSTGHAQASSHDFVTASVHGCSVSPWDCMDTSDRHAAWKLGQAHVLGLQKPVVSTPSATSSFHTTSRSISIRNLFNAFPCERFSDYVACLMLDDGMLCTFFISGFGLLPKLPPALSLKPHNERTRADICPHLSTDSYVRYFIKYILTP